jgi:23S rRNA (guanosine2251-2'-O)-methyltransferase
VAPGQVGGPGQQPEGERRRPRAPSEKRRAAGAKSARAGKGGKGARGADLSPGRAAKQARRREWLESGRAALRVEAGWTVIEGRRPVIEALRGVRTVRRILVAAGAGERGTLADLLELAAKDGVPVEEVPRSLLDAHAETGAHQGVAAVVSEPRMIGLDDLLAIPLGGPEPPFLLALDGVEDPHNLGALARTAEACGAHGLVLPRHRSAPLSATAVKASAGALEHLPVAEAPNLTRALERMRSSGLWCVGLDGEADESLFEMRLADEPVCVVVGGEGAGLHRLVRETCDLLVRIPMTGQVASLNASVAGALALYEVRRRRGGSGASTG